MSKAPQKAQVLKASDNCFKRSTASRQFEDGLDNYLTIPVCGVDWAPIFTYRPCGKTSVKEAVLTFDKPTSSTVKYSDNGEKCAHCEIEIEMQGRQFKKEFLCRTKGKDGQFTEPYRYSCERHEASLTVTKTRKYIQDKFIYIPKETLAPTEQGPMHTQLKQLCHG